MDGLDFNFYKDLFREKTTKPLSFLFYTNKMEKGGKNAQFLMSEMQRTPSGG
jgi:hypothetical protein